MKVCLSPCLPPVSVLCQTACPGMQSAACFLLPLSDIALQRYFLTASMLDRCPAAKWHLNTFKQKQKKTPTYKLIEKIGTLCLVGHIYVVTSSLALNLGSLENLFISLSDDVPFVRIGHFWDD